MQLHSLSERSGGRNRVWLHSVVFGGRFSLSIIFILLLSFMIQPVHQAMANEAIANEAEQTLPEEVVEQLPKSTKEVVNEEQESSVENVLAEEAVTETVSEEDLNEEAVQAEESATSEVEVENDSVDEDITDGADRASSTAQSPEIDTENGTTTDTGETNESDSETGTASTSTTQSTGTSSNANSDASASTSTSETSGDTTTETEDTTSSSTTTGESESANTNPTDTETVSSETVDSEEQNADITPGEGGELTDSSPEDNTASSADDLIDGKVIEDGVNDLVGSVVNEVVSLTRQLVTEENYYQFSRQSCVAVGDGTYHCTSKERTSIDPDSAVYAEQDAEGDMEIYMRTSKGEIKQLTDNTFDDTSPDMDLASMRVVWQRMIDGRYQIISYDLEEREETQLTFPRTNSMEPKVSKEGIVWQAWDNNDWEIMFFDGQFTDQITNNEIQDVTPVIEDGYILWSVLGGEEAEARVYSIESGEVMTIAGHEGGTVANPRFVLVYDTRFDNGDVITQGFDPVTGLAQPIAAQPAELPINIPEPDPIGEIKALIQNKSTSKDKEVITVPVSGSDGDLNLATTSSTTTITLDLHGQLDMPDAADLPPAIAEPDFELGEFDLVITNEASSTTSIMNQPYYDRGTTTINVNNASSTQY